MPNDDLAYARYRTSVAARRDRQDDRDALGGYVDTDHPDHVANSAPTRREAIEKADAALRLATLELDAAFAATRAVNLAG
jgi:hypothetical protein